MKKIISVLLILIVSMFMIACTEQKTNNKKNDDTFQETSNLTDEEKVAQYVKEYWSDDGLVGGVAKAYGTTVVFNLCKDQGRGIEYDENGNEIYSDDEKIEFSKQEIESMKEFLREAIQIESAVTAVTHEVYDYKGQYVDSYTVTVNDLK